MEDIEAAITDIGQLQKYSKGEWLFSAGDNAEGFFYLVSGEIRVYKMDDQGREIEIVRLGPGDFLGEAIVFTAPRFPAYAQATKNSAVLFIDKENFFQNIDKDPALAKFFIILLAKKCVVLNQRVEALGLKTVRQRLIQYLLSRCGGKNSCEIELKIKKVELAKLLGTISETLSRNLKQLQDEGLIEVKANTIIIHDCPTIRHELSL